MKITSLGYSNVKNKKKGIEIKLFVSKKYELSFSVLLPSTAT